MWNNVDPLCWDTHPDVQRFLGFANGDPTLDILKDIESPNPPESQPRERAGNPTVSPTLCFDCRKKIAIDAPYARFTVIQEHPIYTTQTVIVQILDQRDSEPDRGSVYRRGE